MLLVAGKSLFSLDGSFYDPWTKANNETPSGTIRNTFYPTQSALVEDLEEKRQSTMHPPDTPPSRLSKQLYERCSIPSHSKIALPNVLKNLYRDPFSTRPEFTELFHILGICRQRPRTRNIAMAERLGNEINFDLSGPVQVSYEYCKGCGPQGLTC